MLDPIVAILKDVCKNEIKTDVASSPHAVIVSTDDLLTVMEKLYHDPSTYFDMLSCITGIDNGPQAATMEVAYNLYSIPYNYHLMVKVIVSREKPTIPSVSHVWKTANWHERELFDMFGIDIKDHPDLRRILMPADWEGHPLLKDYKHQEYYRDIKIEY